MPSTRSQQFIAGFPETKRHICRLFRIPLALSLLFMAASGDGAFSWSSSMDRLLRGISMSYQVPSVERGHLMNPSSPSMKKKEGFAGAALRRLGCAAEAATQAYDPSVSSVRSSSVSNDKTPGRGRKTEKEGRRIHGGGKISCTPVTPSSTDVSLAGRRLLDAGEVKYPSFALCSSNFGF